jgi:hypothetical protein
MASDELAPVAARVEADVATSDLFRHARRPSERERDEPPRGIGILRPSGSGK